MWYKTFVNDTLPISLDIESTKTLNSVVSSLYFYSNLFISDEINSTFSINNWTKSIQPVLSIIALIALWIDGYVNIWNIRTAGPEATWNLSVRPYPLEIKKNKLRFLEMFYVY